MHFINKWELLHRAYILPAKKGAPSDAVSLFYLQTLKKSDLLDDYQLHLTEKLLYILRKDGHSLTFMSEFFQFLAPLSCLPELEKLHQSVVANVELKNEASLVASVLSSIRNNYIEDALFSFLFNRTAESNLLLMGLAYAANETPLLFKDQRAVLLHGYNQIVSGFSIVFPYELFQTDQMEDVAKLNQVLVASKHNPFLAFALFQAKQTRWKTIHEVLLLTEKFYVEIIEMISAVANHLKENLPCSTSI